MAAIEAGSPWSESGALRTRVATSRAMPPSERMRRYIVGTCYASCRLRTLLHGMQWGGSGKRVIDGRGEKEREREGGLGYHGERTRDWSYVEEECGFH